MVKTEGAPPPPRRRRRRPKKADSRAEVEALPLVRATAINAAGPLPSADAGEAWLAGLEGDEDEAEREVEAGLRLVNRALRAVAVAAGDPYVGELALGQAVKARVGYGTGDEVADGNFTAALEVDVAQRGPRGRVEKLRPQEHVAALLGARTEKDACELLVLRARADLDAGDLREAALQIRVGLEALLAEMRGALADPGHEEDMAILEERRGEAGDAANAALRGALDAADAGNVRELIELCERVLRRRRILRG